MTVKTFQNVPPIQRTAAARTFNVEARTVEVVISTGATVRRYDWLSDQEYLETLDVNGVDLSRAEGAPVLDAHNSYANDSVIGVIERAWIEEGKIIGLLRFSRSPKADLIYSDIVDGIRRQVSVGASVDDYEMVVNENGLTELIARKWTVLEVSPVPIGADAGAVVRSAEQTHSVTVEMADETIASDDQSAAGAEASAVETETAEGTGTEPQPEPVVEPELTTSASPPTETDRNAEIAEMVRFAEQHGMVSMAAEAIQRGDTLTAFKAVVEERSSVRSLFTAARRSFGALLPESMESEIASVGIDTARKMILDRLVAADEATTVRGEIPIPKTPVEAASAEKPKINTADVYRKQNSKKLFKR